MSQKYYDLAPGNVLQNMYLKYRLKRFAEPSMTFAELGSGNGMISRILLENGLRGTGYDLNENACEINRNRNAAHIQSGQYTVVNADFFSISDAEKVDIVISSHVLEHLPSDMLEAFFEKCKSILNVGGKIISLVPSSMKHWGIEDETVGHYRRFEFQDWRAIAERHNLTIDELAGLTYPLSNMVFGLSNYLLRKHESWKKDLSKEEQTLMSSTGAKVVKYKTHFPPYFRYLVNDVTMYPFFVLQRMNKRNGSSMVIYSEMSLPGHGAMNG